MSRRYTISFPEGEPRLIRLAQERARALGIEPGPGADRPHVTADPRVVIDGTQLDDAVARTLAGDRPRRTGGRDIDGAVSGTAATIVPPGADPGDPLEANDSIGTWLPEAQLPPAPDAMAAAVNLFSHVFGATGYAAVGRGLALGLLDAGYAPRFSADWGDMGDPGLREGERARLASLLAPPDRDAPSVMIRPLVSPNGKALLAEYRAVRVRGAAAAYTMFECDGIPQRWINGFTEFESVWLPSTFNMRSFAAAGVPEELLRYVPIGIDAAQYPRGETLTLPNRRRFAFLSVFDWNERKGPDVLLRAWAAAFDAQDDVVLYLRTGESTVGFGGTPLQLARELGLDTARMAPIEVLGEHLDAVRFEALYRSVDAFVLTSRGEAFGIPLLEAMAAGIPAIGTDGGGSGDFLDESTGYPIPATMVPVAPSLARRIGFYADQRWADPSVDATAQALRRVVDDPADAARRASAGFVRAQLAFDRRATGRIARRALDEMPARRTAERGSFAVTVAAPVRSAGAAGDTARTLVQTLRAAGAIVRVEDNGAPSEPLDPDRVRQLREHERVVAANDDPRIVVGADGALPPAFAHVPATVDVDRWSPDVRATVDAGAAVVGIGGEPGWIDAATAVLRAAGATPPRLLVRAGGGTPGDPARVGEGIGAALRASGTTAVPQVALIAEGGTTTARATAVGSADVFVATDPSAAAHDEARACAVPVLAAAQAAQLATLLADPAARWDLAHEQRRAVLSRTHAAGDALRTALHGGASSALVRPLAPCVISLSFGPHVGEPDAMLAYLQSMAAHTIVTDDRGAAYAAEVDEPCRVPVGWDEVLLNALEGGAAGSVRAQRYDELRTPAGEAMPSYDALAGGGFLLSRDGGHAESPLGRGLRITRRARPQPGGWVVYGCVIDAAPRAS